jgi:hydroxymethylpyrimidine/phosphomethylpyrimidine kinase
VSGEPPVGLTIAGSDSGSGAGIQADLKSMAAFGVLATTAITTVTAQNTAEVTGVHHLPAAFVDRQISAVLADLPVAAVKTGMLGTAEIVELVAGRAAAGDLPNLVVDPVMVSSTGHQLLEDGGVDSYRRHLLPQALVATPNLWEAALLSGLDPAELDGVAGMIEAARVIHGLGAGWVLVKGGHLGGVEASSPGHPPAQVPDVLFGSDGPTLVTGEWVDTPNTHGTGCSLSAAIAARLAGGAPVPEAVDDAKRFVHRALQGSAGWRLGRGHGPLDHLGWAARADDQAVAVPGRETTTAGS